MVIALYTEMAEQITDVSRRSPSSEYKVYARIINFTFINSLVSFFNRTWKRSWLSFLTKSFLQIIFGQITSFGIEISEMASIVGALKGGNLFLFFCFCFVCFLVIRPILKKMWNIFKYYTFRFGKRYIYSKWQRNSVFVNYSFSVKKIAMYAAHFT